MTTKLVRLNKEARMRKHRLKKELATRVQVPTFPLRIDAKTVIFVPVGSDPVIEREKYRLNH